MRRSTPLKRTDHGPALASTPATLRRSRASQGVDRYRWEGLPHSRDRPPPAKGRALRPERCGRRWRRSSDTPDRRQRPDRQRRSSPVAAAVRSAVACGKRDVAARVGLPSRADPRRHREPRDAVGGIARRAARHVHAHTGIHAHPSRKHDRVCEVGGQLGRCPAGFRPDVAVPPTGEPESLHPPATAGDGTARTTAVLRPTRAPAVKVWRGQGSATTGSTSIRADKRRRVPGNGSNRVGMLPSRSRSTVAAGLDAS